MFIYLSSIIKTPKFVRGGPCPRPVHDQIDAAMEARTHLRSPSSNCRELRSLKSVITVIITSDQITANHHLQCTAVWLIRVFLASMEIPKSKIDLAHIFSVECHVTSRDI